MKGKVLVISMLVLFLLGIRSVVAQAPTMSVIVLPINEPITVRCQGGDELIATVWGNGEWELECRQYILAVR